MRVPLVTLGLDPGTQGAAAFRMQDVKGGVTWTVIPFRGKHPSAVVAAIMAVMNDTPVDIAAIEEPTPWPGQSKHAAFSLGCSYGRLEALMFVTKTATINIRPVTWQRQLRCLSKGNKQVCLETAHHLACGHDWTKETADAGLLATYAYLYIVGKLDEPEYAMAQIERRNE